MALPKTADKYKQELRTLAESIPFSVIALPEFKQSSYRPEQVRQAREYIPADGNLHAIGRFLVERGVVPLLEPSQILALFREMHWCGYTIGVLARRRYTSSKALQNAVHEARRLISQVEAAEEELFIANRRLVVSCVKPFYWIGQVWIGDFLQEGSRALSNAIRKFDFTRGTPFYAYAQRAIQNRLRNYFRDHVRSGSIGIHPTREMMAIREILDACRTEGREEPDNATLAKMTGMLEERVDKVRPFVVQWTNLPIPPVSLDALMGESEASLYDFVSDSDGDEALAATERSEIWAYMERLPERAKYIMQLRFIEGLTLEETGQMLNLTRARIKQIEDDSLKKLRQMLKRG